MISTSLPLRPTPQATLGASTPGNQTGAVSVTFTHLAYGPVRVHVTAVAGQPEVTNFGEMKMRTDDGRVHVCPNCPEGPC